ncbi:RecB family exonuclease [Nanoarchaeota archaeon]
MEQPTPATESRFARIQSPSSINTFRQCPRRYYYNYIEKLPTKPSIHLIRGNIVHSALEDFFKINIENISSPSYEFELRIILLEHFKKHWNMKMTQLNQLGLSEDELMYYFKDSSDMINNWLDMFYEKVKKKLAKENNLVEAFKVLTPRTEEEYRSDQEGVRGFIDAIHEDEDGIVLMDYKTSKKNVINNAYKLQLAIYAMLYQEKHKKLPDKVGISFLKFDEQYLDVDESLVDFAKLEVRQVHELTQSKNKEDYNKKTSPLCKWSTGQCDFYEQCCKDEDFECR